MEPQKIVFLLSKNGYASGIEKSRKRFLLLAFVVF